MDHGDPPMAPPKRMELKDTLLDLLYALEGVEQDPFYHPEGDVLYHSLQTFEHALEDTEDPDLWAVALLHDIGKSIQNEEHARLGAEILEGTLNTRITWLIRYHMHIVYEPKPTRAMWRGTRQLRELELQRKWDLAGRDPLGWTRDPESAVDLILEHQPSIIFGGISAIEYAI